MKVAQRYVYRGLIASFHSTTSAPTTSVSPQTSNRALLDILFEICVQLGVLEGAWQPRLNHKQTMNTNRRLPK